MLRIAIAAALIATLPAGEALDKEVARFQDAVAKLQKAFDDGTAKEKAKAVPALAAVAKKEVQKGDMPAAAEAWKWVLRLDRKHEDARKFFTALNQLDQVLAELDRKGDEDVLGNQPAKPQAQTVAIPAEPGARTPSFGPVKAGTQMTFQYVGGAWTPNQGLRGPESPDREDAHEILRAVLASERDSPASVLCKVPSGTEKTPFTYRFERDVDKVFLRMNRFGAPRPDGEVQYRITVIPPGAK